MPDVRRRETWIDHLSMCPRNGSHAVERPGILIRMRRNLALALAAICLTAVSAGKSIYDAELAKKLGADERGMKMYVLCILKTGPKDSEVKGDERKEIFAGHFANIRQLADEGKLAVAGPFGKNDKAYRGLYIFNVATIEEAGKLVMLDPAVKRESSFRI